MYAVSCDLPGTTGRSIYTYADAADAFAMADLLRECWHAGDIKIDVL